MIKLAMSGSWQHVNANSLQMCSISQASQKLLNRQSDANNSDV